MKLVCWGLAVAAGLGVASTATAQDDDWEFQQDGARNITVAAARYDAGQMIVAQCREGALTLVVTGLRGEADEVEFQASRADGRRDVQAWRTAGTPGAFRSTVAARDVRFLRGGGAYTIRTTEGEEPAFGATFDLPTESANLDRVLVACDWALTDERDLLTRATELSFSNPNSTGANARPRNGRSVLSRSRNAPGAGPPAPMPGPAEQQFSCIVRNMHTAECRADHPPPPGGRLNEVLLRRTEGRELFAEGEVPSGEQVIYVLRAPAYQVATPPAS